MYIIISLPCLWKVCWFKHELALMWSTQYIWLEKILSWIISPYNCQLVMILLHAHLHIMCYHYFTLHWKPPSGLGGVGLTRCNGQMERKLNYYPLQLSAGSILLHAHLHIMYYHYFKFHWKPPSGFGGVVLTRCNGQTYRQMNGQTERQGDSNIPLQTLFAGGITSFNFEMYVTLDQDQGMIWTLICI